MQEQFFNPVDVVNGETPLRKLETDIDRLMLELEKLRQISFLDDSSLHQLINQVPLNSADLAFGSRSSTDQYHHLFDGRIGKLLERIITRVSETTEHTEFASNIQQATQMVGKPGLLSRVSLIGRGKTISAFYEPPAERIGIYKGAQPNRKAIIYNLANLGHSLAFRNLYHEGVHARQFENLHNFEIASDTNPDNLLYLASSTLAALFKHIPCMPKTQRFFQRMKNLQFLDYPINEAQAFTAHSWNAPLKTSEFVTVFDEQYVSRDRELMAASDTRDHIMEARRLIKLLYGLGVKEDVIAATAGPAKWDTATQTYPTLRTLVDQEMERQQLTDEYEEQILLRHTLDQYVFAGKLRVITTDELINAIKK